MEQTFCSDEILARFNRLIQDVMRGDWRRNSFTSWEMELLLDIHACGPELAVRRDLLARYQKAVQRQLFRRREMPMTLTAYIESLRERQAMRVAAAAERPVCAPALS